jgi:hypothetical protein
MRRNGLRDLAIVRRHYAAVAATFIYMISTGKGNLRRTRFSRKDLIFSEHVNGLFARQFCRMYRLSKEAFQQLVTVISEHRQRAGRRPGRHAVDADSVWHFAYCWWVLSGHSAGALRLDFYFLSHRR